MNTSRKEADLPEELEPEAFGELFRYTTAGFGIGLVLGWILDHVGLQQHPVGQWAVRTFSGESESIFEGLYAIRQRLRGSVGSLAEAYGWGKLLGMAVPWVVDAASRMAGVDLYGIEGFYIAWFYAMSDQVGANVVGFLYLKRDRSTVEALRAWFTNPVMLTSLLVVLLVPFGLLAARIAGFSPTTQVRTAVETFAANLCWVPPLVGLLAERWRSRPG